MIRQKYFHTHFDSMKDILIAVNFALNSFNNIISVYSLKQ